MVLFLLACSPVLNDAFNVEVDGAVLPVQIRGNLSRGVLVVHEPGGPSGGALDARLSGYYPYADTLETEVAVVYYDRRGFGNVQGAFDPNDITVPGMVRDLEAVTDVALARHDVEQLVLFGHSWGGFVTGEAILAAPERYDGWVAAAPAVLNGEQGDAAYLPWRRAMACRVADDEVRSGSDDPIYPEILDFCAENPTIPDQSDDPIYRQLWAYLYVLYERFGTEPPIPPSGVARAAFFSFYNLTDSHLRMTESGRAAHEAASQWPTLLPRLEEVTTPTVVLTGFYDDVIPTELGAEVAKTIGPSHAQHIDLRAGHSLIIEQPDAVTDAVWATLE